ncbi:gliding motility-associated C-terminal domain-containing protein [Hugenholtzia roseola]|uniref:T9SS type B sorting domain-containing protein n=1 Tax=Hugenholtzia roseola TaxID=1002 RepID=UPI00040F9F5B|nr:gliding motility-associated C-terminal domain-containing protein [Hugenholtzia roseola]
MKKMTLLSITYKIFFLSALIWGLPLFFSSALLQAQVNSADSLALVNFYTANFGGTWTNPWRLNEPVSRWQGVVVENGRVVALRLGNRRMAGALSNALAGLPLLRELDLSSNSLSGGAVNLLNIPNLQTLNVSACTQLVPNLDSNSPILQLAQIRNLTLSNLGLETGAENLVALAATLESLNLSNNAFSGDLPANWRSLSRLRSLNIANNEFEKVMEVIVGLRNLQFLIANNNKIKEEISPSFNNLSQLQEWNMSRNQLFGEIPTLTALRELRICNLSNNQLSGQIPNTFATLPKLENVNLSNNLFQDTAPAGFFASPTLRVLNISNNNLTYLAIGDLGITPVLHTLIASHNEISDQDEPMAFSLLRNLVVFDISYNALNSLIINGFYSLAKLEQLNVSHNRLSESVSVNVENLRQIRTLNLSNNRLTGILPKELGGLQQATELNLSHNLFLESPPSQLNTLPALQRLYLNDNLFQDLPIFTIDTLEILHVQNNRLTFEDLEDNLYAAKREFRYSPQANVPMEQNCQLSVEVGGRYNRYQWLFEGDTLLFDTLSFINAYQSGSYQCLIANDSVRELILESEIVMPNFLVPFIPKQDSIFCAPFEYVLDGGENGQRYEWSTGETTRFITVTEEGEYSVRVFANTCQNSDTIKIIYRGGKNNIISADQLICNGEQPAQLIGGESDPEHGYLWQSSDNGVDWRNEDSTLFYQPPSLAKTQYYRRLVLTDSCPPLPSNVVKISVVDIAFDAQVVQPSCPEGRDGEIRVLISQTAGNFSAIWADDSTATLNRTNLAAGTYTLWVRDSLGCEEVFSIEIPKTELLQIEIEVQQASCGTAAADGAIRAKASGGIAPYRYEWLSSEEWAGEEEGESFTEEKTGASLWENLAPSQTLPYRLVVTDARGCQKVEKAILLQRTQPVSAEFAYEKVDFCREEPYPKPQILGQQGGRFFSDSPDLRLNSLTGEIRLDETPVGEYLIRYRANDCSESAVTVAIFEGCFNTIPNTFSPNGDGVNETWEVPLFEAYPALHLQIFDRNGTLLFDAPQGFEAWDGTFEGKPLPEGTYFYQVDLGTPFEQRRKHQGFISLIR